MELGVHANLYTTNDETSRAFRDIESHLPVLEPWWVRLEAIRKGGLVQPADYGNFISRAHTVFGNTKTLLLWDYSSISAHNPQVFANELAQFLDSLSDDQRPDAVELWNEPDQLGDLDPGDFAEYLIAGSARLRERGIASVAGGTTNVLGDLGLAYWRYVQMALNRITGSADFPCDAIACHPYPWWESYDAPEVAVITDPPDVLVQRVSRLRHLAGIPVWVTEFGLTTAGYGEAGQRGWLRQMAQGLAGAGVPVATWYRLEDEPAAVDAATFGLLREDGGQKLAAGAFLELSRALG